MGQDWARPIVHWEMRARDAEALRTFYGELFNWKIGDGPFMTIPAGIGGPEPGPAGHLVQSDNTGITLYIQVRNLRETLDKAAVLGGTITAEPFDLPNTPTLASIADPEGNPVMLVQQ